MKRAVLPVMLFLAACGTPQEQCISRNTKDLRAVEKLIAEAEGNLKRGYAIETVTYRETVMTWCRMRVPGPPDASGAPTVEIRSVPCRDVETRTVKRPKSIDLELEARKLAQLRDKRVQLSRAAQPVIAQCKAEYPE
ncbi:hypothetical protein [Pseudogemmobacter sonorensis]|uniref:hypothetical protein n=1 Tax=Pseudogemmobacter sonorensis TaxID=2989681 RepID=UPI0036B87F1D